MLLSTGGGGNYMRLTEFTPTPQLLRAAKSVTATYNQAHTHIQTLNNFNVHKHQTLSTLYVLVFVVPPSELMRNNIEMICSGLTL